MCVDPQTGQRRFESAAIPSNIAIDQRKSSNESNGMLNIYWLNDIPRFGRKGHRTQISLEEVYNMENGIVAESLDLRKRSLWRQQPPTVFHDYTAFLNEERAQNALLNQLQNYGIVSLMDVPQDEQAVERIGEKIGPLRHTFYGRTWDVRDEPGAQNVAYTSYKLPLHMDLL